MITDGELLHLAICLAYQEVGIEATTQEWGRLNDQKRRFFEVAARQFLAALREREAMDHGRTDDGGDDQCAGDRRSR